MNQREWIQEKLLLLNQTLVDYPYLNEEQRVLGDDLRVEIREMMEEHDDLFNHTLPQTEDDAER